VFQWELWLPELFGLMEATSNDCAVRTQASEQTIGANRQIRFTAPSISRLAIFRRFTNAPANDSRKRLLIVGQQFGGESLERDTFPAGKFGSIVIDPRELFTLLLTGRSC
jgi:hypothetical protein